MVDTFKKLEYLGIEVVVSIRYDADPIHLEFIFSSIPALFASIRKPNLLDSSVLSKA
jgi:hypothetical protein